MDDMHRAPGNGDRDRVRARIKQAVADGRITSADGDIRLGNATSAQSLADLDLIVRDLDQVDAVLPAGAAAPIPQTTWTPTSQAEQARSAATGAASRTVPFLILGLVVALLVAGGIGIFVFAGTDSGKSESSTSSGVELPEPVSPGAEPATEEPVDNPEATDGASPEAPAANEQADGAPFVLSADGVKSFMTFYKKKFGTTKVIDLTMYGDYAVVRVPVPGKKRNSGWLYRDGKWQDFGGVTANFPGSAAMDLRDLDVAAMMRNLSKARRTLNVENPKSSYVTLNYRPQFDDVPNVNIYVSNEFNESGYLATTLGGKVERAYPFSS